MGESQAGRKRGGAPTALRVLMAVGFVIALAATVLVVVAEDVRLLRLGAVLALWAALVAAFAVSRSRRDVKAAMLRQSEAQLAYQLELQREVTARREYEADLATTMAASQSEQIAELREQLDRLTEVLTSLSDGEFLLSRLTVSAESARFRAGSQIANEASLTASAPLSIDAAAVETPQIDSRDRVPAPAAANERTEPTPAAPAPAEEPESVAEPVVEPVAASAPAASAPAEQPEPVVEPAAEAIAVAVVATAAVAPPTPPEPVAPVTRPMPAPPVVDATSPGADAARPTRPQLPTVPAADHVAPPAPRRSRHALPDDDDDAPTPPAVVPDPVRRRDPVADVPPTAPQADPVVASSSVAEAAETRPTTVEELLAAYGLSEGTPRRRRS